MFPPRRPAAAGVGTINYGLFIQNIVNFILTAFCMFLVIRAMNKVYKKPEPAPEKPKRIARSARAKSRTTRPAARTARRCWNKGLKRHIAVELQWSSTVFIFGHKTAKRRIPSPGGMSMRLIAFGGDERMRGALAAAEPGGLGDAAHRAGRRCGNAARGGGDAAVAEELSGG